MTGIYYIINKLNNKKYIGSSINVNIRLNTHFNRLKNCNHPNKYLQSAVLKYGLEHFEGRFIEQCSTEELLIVEQEHIDSYSKDELYNLTFITGSGGYDTLSKSCYLIDLNGKITKKYDSIMDCSRAYNCRINTSSSVNTGSIFKKIYRIVTIDFYNENLDLILNWKNYTSEVKKRYENKTLRQIIIYNDIEYANKKEVSKVTGLSIERIRQILNSSSKKFNMKFKYPELQKN